MSTKSRILVIITAVLTMIIPVAAVAYQLHNKERDKNLAEVGKLGLSNQPAGGGSNTKGTDKADKYAGSVSGDSHARLERFNKARLKKHIEQFQNSKRITDVQARLLNKKLSELEEFVRVTKSKSSQDQVRDISDKLKELKGWAKNNSIPARYIAGWL